MEIHSEIDLRAQFIRKCKENLLKLPQIYLSDSIYHRNLIMNLQTFKLKDFPFIEIMLTLPFKMIHLFEENIPQPKIQTKEKQLQDKNSKKKIGQRQKLAFLLNQISRILIEQNDKHLRVLKFENIPLQINQLQILSTGIQKSKYLKQLALINCSLKDIHLKILKSSLSSNVSLNSLDLSINHLRQIGDIICEVLFQHGQRKNNILSLHQRKNKVPDFDVSNTGLYQINLEGNNLSIKSIDHLIGFLKEDIWVKCFNLKQNRIEKQRIEEFISLLNFNSSLINLDLRQNQGMNKKYSKIIFTKLKENLLRLKQSNSNFISNEPLRKKRSQESFHQACPVNSPKLKITNTDQKEIEQKAGYILNQLRQFNKQPVKSDIFQIFTKQRSRTKVLIKGTKGAYVQKFPHSEHKSDHNMTQSQQIQAGRFARVMTLNQILEKKATNKASVVVGVQMNDLKLIKKQIKFSQDELTQLECKKCNELQMRVLKAELKCREMQIRTLKAEKESFELQLELKKLRSFIEKNVDVSVIGLSANKLHIQNSLQLNAQNSNISTSFNKILVSQNEDDMILRIQIMVSQLTKIMEAAELFQNTQNTIEQPFSNVNSFSKTISLYEKPKDLIEIQQQILQDQALHLQQFGEGSSTLLENGLQPNENFFKLERNQLGD